MVAGTMATAISLSIYLLRPGKEVDYDRDIGDDRTSRAPLFLPRRAVLQSGVLGDRDNEDLHLLRHRQER